MLRKKILFMSFILCSLILMACEKGILNPFEPETSPSAQAQESKVNKELNNFNCFKMNRNRNSFKFLKLSVAYLNPLSFTPDSLPVYLIGSLFHYEIRIQNTSKSLKMKNLTIKVAQEYENTGTCDRYWYQSPRIIDFKEGDILPGQSFTEFTDITISPGEAVILRGSYHPPLQSCSAICRTHVEISLVPDLSARSAHNRKQKSRNGKRNRKSHKLATNTTISLLNELIEGYNNLIILELAADITIPLLDESKAGMFYLKFGGVKESVEEKPLEEESKEKQELESESAEEKQLEEESKEKQELESESKEEQELESKSAEKKQLKKEKGAVSKSLKITISKELKKRIALFKNNQIEEAKEIFKKEVNENPENWYARNYLSKIYIKEKKYDKAIKEINRAVEDFKKRDNIK